MVRVIPQAYRLSRMGGPPGSLSLTSAQNFQAVAPSRQGRGRVVLRGRANRMERTETKRNQHAAQRAVEHHHPSV